MACHQRIRSFGALALRIGGQEELSATELAEGCQRVSRYFAEALPLHVQDEEDGLIPALRSQEPAIDRALEQMASEHLSHAPLLAALEQALRETIASAGEPSARARIAAVAQELVPELERHLAQEEALIFPAIPRLLSAEAQGRLIVELRARRR